MNSSRPPNGGDFETDAVTYLPVDKSKAADPIYGKTDIRENKAVGGMPLSRPHGYISKHAATQLNVEQIRQACAHIVAGQTVYRSLVLLSRASSADIEVMWRSSHDEEVRTRWERIWVLAPFVARLIRPLQIRPVLIAAFQQDLAGVHLLARFVEQGNPAVKKIFERLGAPLLTMLLKELAAALSEPRKANLIVGILAAMETREDELKAAMPTDIPQDMVEQVLKTVYIRYEKEKATQLSSATLREKLKSWRR